MIKQSRKNLLFSKKKKILTVRLPLQRCPKSLLSGTGVIKDIIRVQKSCTGIIENTLF